MRSSLAITAAEARRRSATVFFFIAPVISAAALLAGRYVTVIAAPYSMRRGAGQRR